jgi:hypothetical protein
MLNKIYLSAAVPGYYPILKKFLRLKFYIIPNFEAFS